MKFMRFFPFLMFSNFAENTLFLGKIRQETQWPPGSYRSQVLTSTFGSTLASVPQKIELAQ